MATWFHTSVSLYIHPFCELNEPTMYPLASPLPGAHLTTPIIIEQNAAFEKLSNTCRELQQRLDQAVDSGLLPAEDLADACMDVDLYSKPHSISP